jgi:hypothetical protein
METKDNSSQLQNSIQHLNALKLDREIVLMQQSSTVNEDTLFCNRVNNLMQFNQVLDSILSRYGNVDGIVTPEMREEIAKVQRSTVECVVEYVKHNTEFSSKMLQAAQKVGNATMTKPTDNV